MRAVLYLLSLVLALPGIGLAAALLILGSAISTHSWWGFFGVLLDTAAWLLPWGLLACMLALLALFVGGLMPRFRWLASSCVAFLALASSAVVLAITTSHGEFSSEKLTFFGPAVISAALSTWIAAREWPRRSRTSVSTLAALWNFTA